MAANIKNEPLENKENSIHDIAMNAGIKYSNINNEPNLFKDTIDSNYSSPKQPVALGVSYTKQGEWTEMNFKIEPDEVNLTNALRYLVDGDATEKDLGMHLKNKTPDEKEDSSSKGRDLFNIWSPGVAILKEELDIGATVLQPPDIYYMMQQCKPEPIDTDSKEIMAVIPYSIKRSHEINALKYIDCTSTRTSYYCDVCDERFSKKRYLRKHIFLHDQFGTRENLPKKLNEHPHRCDICDKDFVTKYGLKKHIFAHTGKRPHSCSLCGNSFKQKKDLTYHTRVHTGERPYGCTVCDKRFKKKQDLDVHMHIHLGERPYGCDVCEKRFVQRTNLVSHMMTHTGRRPHCCNICPKDFLSSSDLKKHKLTHTADRPYHCGICGKGFIEKSKVKRHMSTHSSEKSHFCQICGNCLWTKKALSIHMSAHSDA